MNVTPQETAYKKERSAGIVIFKREQGQVDYLLLKYRSGHWDFPKGKCEPGETDHEAAHRELFEETGLRARIIENFSHTFSYIFRNVERTMIDKTVIFFVGELIGSDQVTLSDEHLDCRWMRYPAACRQVTHLNARKLLEEVDAFLKHSGF